MLGTKAIEIKTSFLPSSSCWSLGKPDQQTDETHVGASAGPGVRAGTAKNRMHLRVAGEVPPRFDFSLEISGLEVVAEIGQGIPEKGA